MSIIGQRFSKLVITAIDVPAVYSYGTYQKVICRCDCGNEISAFPSNLRRGATKSCGCHKKATAGQAHFKHGLRRTPEYTTWCSMRKRCYTKTYREFHLYGGRGIGICDAWRDNFLNFLRDMGLKPEGLSLDRIDNSKDYSPENCRWADPVQQTGNRRMTVHVEFAGERVVLADFARRHSLSYFTAYSWFIRKRLPEADIAEKLATRQSARGTP